VRGGRAACLARVRATDRQTRRSWSPSTLCLTVTARKHPEACLNLSLKVSLQRGPLLRLGAVRGTARVCGSGWAPRSSTARPCASARNKQLPSPGTRSTSKLGTAAVASAASAAQHSDDARALLALHAARGARCGGRLLRALCAGVCRCCAVRAEAVQADSEGSMPAQLACQVRKVPAYEVTLFAGRHQGSTCERGSQGRPPARQACWPRVDVHHLCCCVGHPAASRDLKSSKAINDGRHTQARAPASCNSVAAVRTRHQQLGLLLNMQIEEYKSRCVTLSIRGTLTASVLDSTPLQECGITKALPQTLKSCYTPHSRQPHCSTDWDSTTQVYQR